MRFLLLLASCSALFAQQLPPCPRPAPGGVVRPPAELHSSGGTLHVDFSLRTRVDVYGLTLFCFAYGDNLQSPTLRVQPGDEVVLMLKNELPPGAGAHAHGETKSPESCGGGSVAASSTNLHFHGLNIPPTCHQDDVIHTLVQPGAPAFEYRFKIPPTQPPGLYWYHPHPHGFTERQVQGGASGALIVEGIERAAPQVAGIPERVLVLRDQLIGGVVEDSSKEEGDEARAPSLDLSVNYVPVMYPLYKPSIILARPRQREFWRVLNASADTFFDLRLMYWPNPETAVPQPLRLIAIDGVPVGPDFAPAAPTSVLLPPGARAEFLMTTPPSGIVAQFLTTHYDNGPDGNRDSYRVLANIRSFDDSPLIPAKIPEVPAAVKPTPFPSLLTLKPARQRTLYFSEKIEDPNHPKQNASYFLTAGDATPKVFDMNFTAPDLTATQGTVEDWIIENRATESHAFHIHQLHFQLIERDGKAVRESALHDTIELPFWDGKSATYPSVKIRMDFRDPNIIGTFLYHCHILEHEDGGMMGSIEVRPLL